MSTYYSIFLQVRADENITIKEYLSLEKKVKSQLKETNKLIRFIDIEIIQIISLEKNMIGKFFECEANKKYQRVIKTLKEYREGKRR